MNRGVDHATVFTDDVDRRDFVRLLGRGCAEHDVEVHAWCLMPNHYHLLVRDPGNSLSCLMRWVGTTYVRHFNDRHDRDGPLFRGRFHSLEVRGDDYLQWLGRYIHRNPEAIGTAPLSEYPWSSLPDYLGCRTPPGWVHTERLLGYHGGNAAHFAEFTLAEPSAPRLCADAASAAISVLAEDHAARTDQSPRGVRTAIEVLVDPSAPATAAERKARERAVARRTADPDLARIVDALGPFVR